MCIQVGDLPLALTVEQAAKMLNISRNLAYDLVRQGVIPSLRLGRIIDERGLHRLRGHGRVLRYKHDQRCGGHSREFHGHGSRPGVRDDPGTRDGRGQQDANEEKCRTHENDSLTECSPDQRR